jgi:hypothetical protein
MRLRRAAWLITFTVVSQSASYFYALFEHLDEPTWVPHAQFHHVLAWIWLTGLNIVTLILTWIPLQKREPWSRWALLCVLVFGTIGHYAASLIVPAGRPYKWWYDYALISFPLMFGIGLWMAWDKGDIKKSG